MKLVLLEQIESKWIPEAGEDEMEINSYLDREIELYLDVATGRVLTNSLHYSNTWVATMIEVEAVA